MRRPLSIMRASREDGWVEFLYKVVGSGTELLSRRTTGESVSLLGPIGVPFSVDERRSRPLLVGGGVGIPPMIFLADVLRHDKRLRPLLLMGSEVPFPFPTHASDLAVPGLPDATTASIELLDEWGVTSRLASGQDYAGCYRGYVTELARMWLATLESSEREEVQIFACGPHPMLEAVARLAKQYELPCQISLEEFMACAVGGCAGCVVEIRTSAGSAMKRVCVDGPVFEASSVVFD